MARTKIEPEQLELMEVKDALAKVLEDLFGEYGAENRKKNKALKRMKEVRADILQKIKARGIKPDADGVIAFRMNGKRWRVEPGESKRIVTEEKDQSTKSASADE